MKAAMATWLGLGVGMAGMVLPTIACDDSSEGSSPGTVAGNAGTGGSGGSGATGGSGGAGGAVPDDCELHVSPTGDGSECSAGAPCSLEGARDRLRADSAPMTADVHVCLAGGRYLLAAPFELDGALDSGRDGHEIVYTAAPGETPELSGGMVVTGWEPFASGVFRAAVPAGSNSRQLYVDGVRADRARGPESPAGFQETSGGYLAPDAAMAAWLNPTDIELVDLVEWKAFRCPVAAIVGTAITMAEPCWSLAQWHGGFDMGVPSWVENAIELLDAPGEWYLDRPGAELYYAPRPGEDLATAEVVVPVLETLVRVTGTAADPAHAIRFRGLAFTHATWLAPSSPAGYPVLQAGYRLVGDPSNPTTEKTPAAVTVDRAQAVVFEGNRFEHLGAVALGLDHAQGCTIEGNLFSDLSGTAIHLGDVHEPQAAPTDTTEGNVIRDNFVTDTGREYLDQVAIFAGYVANTTIEHNEIDNVPYSAISLGWGWSLTPTVAAGNLVTANIVRHSMQRLRDGGFVYSLSAQPGTTIQANWLHDLEDDYGGIYLDQGSQGLTLSANVIASTPRWYVLQPVVPPPAQGNTVSGNYTDNSSALCCGALGCCTDINTVTDNTVVAHGPPAGWPAAATAVMAEAGLTASHDDVRPRRLRVEAEDYAWGGEGVSYHDLTASNLGGAYRGDGVDLYWGQAFSNRVVVGYTQTGEWLDYYLDVPADGDYRFEFAVATITDTDAILMELDGAPLATVALPNTGSWQTVGIAAVADLALGRGPHLLRLTFTGGFNFDYFTYRRD